MTALILLGPPGVGKGTQAAWLSKYLGVPTISTGEIFRANIAEQTELGALAQRYMDKGEFVPDSVTTPMVATRLATPDVDHGFILDGYPRKIEQAHALRDMLVARGVPLDLVLELSAPEDELIRRLEGRATQEGRADDSAEVYRRRLEIYRQQTEPIATYYADQDLLEVVDAQPAIPQVQEAIAKVLKERSLEAAGE